MEKAICRTDIQTIFIIVDISKQSNVKSWCRSISQKLNSRSFFFFSLPFGWRFCLLAPAQAFCASFGGDRRKKRVQTSPGNSWLLCEINLHIAENVLWNIERGFKGCRMRKRVCGGAGRGWEQLLLVRRHKRIRMNRFPYANIHICIEEYFFMPTKVYILYELKMSITSPSQLFKVKWRVNCRSFAGITANDTIWWWKFECRITR